MISSEVQRTLVKSPPELWAELSDPATLARHLGELGEIKITKIEPEQTVEWEAEAARGKVELKPSGWGTKVTLSVYQELPDLSIGEAGRDGDGGEAKRALAEQGPVEEVEARAADEPPLETHAETHDVAEVEPEIVKYEPDAVEQVPAVEQEQAPAAEQAPAEEQAAADEQAADDEQAPAGEPTPRPGFFARLFRRKAKNATAGAAEPEPVAAEPEPVAAEPDPAQPEPEPEQPEPADAGEPADLSAELAAAEAALAAQTTRVLTLALDRLGAAHHRPFSRS